MVSTPDLSELPDIETLRQRFQQMAALEAVFAIESGTCVYEFHPNWGSSEQMGAIKSGSGDELFAHFTPLGCFIKGFAHESVMSPFKTKPPSLWPGLLSSVPSEFKSSLNEPAFDLAATTFVVWRLANDVEWHTDEIQLPSHDYGDGSQDLLEDLVMSPSQFAEWLEENFECDVDASVVACVFERNPITNAQLRALNSSAAIADLRRAVQETGYPLA